MKPCPFCGGESPNVESWDGWVHVGCSDCGARGPVYGSDEESETHKHDCAVASWNAVFREGAAS
jgi:hypothetical protein